MGRKKEKSYLSLEQAIDESGALRIVIEIIDFAMKEISTLKMNELCEAQRMLETLVTRMKLDYKRDLEFKERIENPQAGVLRNAANDRKFKLDTVKIIEFSQGHEKNLDEATIHIGMNADEYTRRFNALALTVGTDIFFRNGEYKPETEEGRKLLAHELTHVAQNKDSEEYRNSSREELEAEAEQEERKESHEEDPFVIYDTGKRKVRIRKSEAKKIEELSERNLDKWLSWQKFSLNDREYLDLLVKVQKYMGRI